MTNGFAALWEARREAVHGWSLSLVFHGLVGAAALFAMTNILVVKNPEPFRLNMSILKPPPQPVGQQMVAQTPVTKPIVQEQRVERPPIEPQVVHKAQALKTPVPQRRALQSKPVQPMTEPVIAPTPVTQQVAQITEISPTPAPVRPSVTTRSQRKAVHQTVTAVPKPTLVADHQAKRHTAIQQVAVVSRHEERVVESVPPRFEHISAIVTGAISQFEPSLQQPSTKTFVTRHAMPRVRTKQPSLQSTPPQVIKRTIVAKVLPSVVTREVKQDPTPTADYSWVANSLLKKVQRLKRYPSRAKKREWEGTVELRVSIRSDGEIHDIRILESSGHQALDQEALNTVAMASPLALDYPLGRSIVMVDLPIRYKLN